VTSTNLSAPSSPSTNRTLPAVPHLQTWSLSEEANKKCGTCRVCFATRQLHNKDGTIHKHGPRDNPCSGSHQPPQPYSVRSANIQSHRQSTSSIGANVASFSTCTNSAIHEVNHSTSLNSDATQHPVRSGPIPKRIPKNARAHVGNFVVKLINDVISHPMSVTCWSRLLGFPSACLAKSSRGRKSRNLTTQIINQVQQYEAGAEISPAHFFISFHFIHFILFQ